MKITLNNSSRLQIAAGGWLVILAGIVAGSVAVDASISTTALLFFIGLTPPGIVLLIGLGAPPPRVAELLHSVDGRAGRR